MPSDFIGPINKSGYKPPKRKLTWKDMKSRLSHKTKTRISYFFVSLVYALISTIIVAALAFGVSSFLNDKIISLFPKEMPQFEPAISSIYKGSNIQAGSLEKTDLTVPLPDRQFAVLDAKNLGIDSVPIYCGTTDRIKEAGIGFNPDGGMPGSGAYVYLSGTADYLKGLKNVNIGDLIMLTTNYGVFKYKVTKTNIISKEEADFINTLVGKETLVINIPHPFKILSDARYKVFSVYAEKFSGPSVSY